MSRARIRVTFYMHLHIYVSVHVLIHIYPYPYPFSYPYLIPNTHHSLSPCRDQKKTKKNLFPTTQTFTYLEYLMQTVELTQHRSSSLLPLTWVFSCLRGFSFGVFGREFLQFVRKILTDLLLFLLQLCLVVFVQLDFF